MQEYLNMLDDNLVYIKHIVKGDMLLIYCESKPDKNKKVHTRHERIIKDIPYGEYKVELHLISKRYFNNDENTKSFTITEKFNFLNSTGRRTKRLDNKIFELSKENSAIGNERLLKSIYANISDTTILRIIKKNANS